MVDFAKIAYEAYAEHQGWRNFQGKPIPPWHEVLQGIKNAWAVAVAAVMEACEDADC